MTNTDSLQSFYAFPAGTISISSVILWLPSSLNYL